MFRCERLIPTHHPTFQGMSLRYGVIVLRNLMRLFTKKSCYHQGFFAVKRRAVFILGAMWWALVRGWRRDCVVGGMETRFQWRKTHSRTAKCEAFHVAPRLFFRFLFLIPFTIRQHCIIYSPEIFHWADITKNSVRSQNDNWGLRRVMGADLRFFCYICISISSKQTSFVIVSLWERT